MDLRLLLSCLDLDKEPCGRTVLSLTSNLPDFIPGIVSILRYSTKKLR